jgi:hypothetical protein
MHRKITLQHCQIPFQGRPWDEGKLRYSNQQTEAHALLPGHREPSSPPRTASKDCSLRIMPHVGISVNLTNCNTREHRCSPILLFRHALSTLSIAMYPRFTRLLCMSCLHTMTPTGTCVGLVPDGKGGVQSSPLAGGNWLISAEGGEGKA